jgi:integrase
MTAKAYRLLRAVLMTTVDGRIIARNPCRIRGARSEPTAERPVLSVAQVYDLAARMPKGTPYQLLVLVATFGSLRWGEVTALRRADIDDRHDLIRIRSAFPVDTVGRSSGGSPSRGAASVRSSFLVRSWSC